MVDTKVIDAAKEHFGTVLEQQLERVERIKEEADWTDYSALKPIVIGMIGGDGIGPTISAATQRVLELLLKDHVASGKVQFKTIEGLTIENRAAKVGKLEATLSDPKLIRKTLLKIDPSRVVPAKAGEPFAGPVTRDRLRELAKRYDEDVIFVFRGELNIEPESLTEKELLSTKHVVYIRYRGLLYLARQKRVLVLKGNEKMDQFAGSVSPEQREERWRNLSVDGLKTLAQEARKLLHSHKFEKRQSAY